MFATSQEAVSAASAQKSALSMGKFSKEKYMLHRDGTKELKITLIETLFIRGCLVDRA
jgi:hypothetical protein